MLHRETVTPTIREWSGADDLWVRRSSIICQVGHKAETDLDLLTDVIEPNIADRDFFIRKAIGWALREVAYVEPGWVHAFIDAHRDAVAAVGARGHQAHRPVAGAGSSAVELVRVRADPLAHVERGDLGRGLRRRAGC